MAGAKFYIDKIEKLISYGDLDAAKKELGQV